MMNELISKEDVIHHIMIFNAISNQELTVWGVCELIRDFPSAQPDRKKGKWQIVDAYPHNVYCSVCHKKYAQTHWEVWEDKSLPRNYCPNCGADMRGGINDV